MKNKPKCITDTNGNKYWYLNDKLHREDGPAVEMADGTKKWCINDHDVTQEITKWATDNNIDLYNLSEVDKALIKLVWADYGK